MKYAYLIVEGEMDKLILSRLLDSALVKRIEIVNANDKYSALSWAQAVLAEKRLPVALVVDSDTNDDHAIREQKAYSESLLGSASPGIPLKVTFAVPEIESLFANSPLALKCLLPRRRFSKQQTEWARLHPKEFLTSVTGKPWTLNGAISLLEKMNEEALEQIRQHPLLKELHDFLNHATKPVRRSRERRQSHSLSYMSAGK